MGKKLLLFILSTVILSLACEITLLKGALSGLENRSWDWRAELVAKSQSGDQAIKLLQIDQASLDYFELQGMSWPLPRAVYSKILAYFKGVEIKGLAFDLVLPERQPAVDPAGGAEAEESLRPSFPVISGVSLLPIKVSSPAGSAERFREKQTAQAGSMFVKQLSQSGHARSFVSAQLPGAADVAGSTALGNVHAYPDRDGILRRYLPLAKVGDLAVLGLAFSFYSSASAMRNVTDLAQWTGQDGMLTLRFSAPRSFKSYSLASIYRSHAALAWGNAPEVKPQEFAGSWILVGMTAPGLSSARPAPIDPELSELEYHATALDNLINQSFVKRVSPLYDNLLASLFIALAGATAIFMPGAIAQIFLLSLLGAAFVGSALFLALHGYWISLVAPGIFFVLSAIVGLSGALSFERRREP